MTPELSLDAATPVQTDKGMARVDALPVGQRVLTRDGSYQPITAIESRHLSNRDLRDAPDLAPIRFDPGALPGMPDGPAILISPDCPIEWAHGPQEAGRFAARAFCDGGLIRWVMPDEGITYIRLHFTRSHQLCLAGLWVELGHTPDAMPDTAIQVPTLVHDTRVFRPLKD